MLQSNGVVVKSTTVIWQGPITQWPASLPIGNRWSSYSELYRRQLWVNVVIDKRGKAAARLPFKVYQRNDAGRTDAGSTPFGQLMARPSKRMDPFTFWLWTVNTKDIFGEAPWLKIRDAGGRPIELVPIHPLYLHDQTNGDGSVTWEIRLPSGTIKVNRDDLVLHREFSPDTQHRGMSKLEALRSTLENEDGARRANSALWRNGGKPSVLLEHPSQLSDEAVTRLGAQWADVHGGVDNWAKAAILEEGMKATVLPLNNDELQYIEVRRLNREEVCAAYDMAPPVVHILDRATFSNITEQHRSMYRDTMGTVLGALESTVEFELRDGRFGKQGEPDFSDGVYGEFLLDEVLRGAFEARAAAYNDAEWMTLAEKREKENLPFIPGTDHIFLNSATLPLGADGMLMQPALDAGTGTDTADDEPVDETGDPNAIALLLQKIYLAVDVVITADEARDIANRLGAGLTGSLPAKAKPQPPAIGALPMPPAPQDAPPAPVPIELRSVMGRLSPYKALADVDPEFLVRGMGDDALPVLHALFDARLMGDDIDGFKARLKGLAAWTP